MNLKHFAIVTGGVVVGLMLVPTLAPMLPALPLNLNTAIPIAVGVILVTKLI
jgi:hypothetical protein